MKLLTFLLCFTLIFASFDGWTQTMVAKPLSTYLQQSLPSLSVILDTDFGFPLISNVWREIAHPSHFWMWVVEDDDKYTIFINADDPNALAVNAKTGHINPGTPCF